MAVPLTCPAVPAHRVDASLTYQLTRHVRNTDLGVLLARDANTQLGISGEKRMGFYQALLA